MKNWKLSKIQIQGFKAFTLADFDFASKTLVTLEGPNGYGKTTVFDAIELLLTGRIARLSKLFDKVMSKNKVNYADNLYWNTKAGQKTLFIKAQFFDGNSGETCAFARFSTPELLSVPANNRADKFEIFKLCSLDDLYSSDFSKLLPVDYFDTFFGENFTNNYAMLNYLHQGESSFIFGSSTTERKGALESLINSKEIVEKIDFCTKAERKLSLILNSTSESDETARLEKLIGELSTTPVAGAKLQYVKLSTKIPAPRWDLEEPFPAPDANGFLDLTQKVGILHAASNAHAEIKIRLKNREIERYVLKNDNLFSLAVKIGKHLDSYDGLKSRGARLTDLAEIATRLSKDAKDLLLDDITFVESKNIAFAEGIRDEIETRDKLSKRAGELNGRLAAVLKARDDLLKAFDKLRQDHESACPMCGHDWSSQQQLLEAIALTATSFRQGLDELGKQLSEAIRKITEIVTPVREKAAEEQRLLGQNMNRALLDSLESSKETFDNLRKLNARLSELKIDYEEDFSADEAVLANRKAALIERVRALKQKEGTEPPTDWESTIVEGFKTFDDFYAIEAKAFLAKLDYVGYMHRDRQNSVLQHAKKQLSERVALKDARAAAKSKITALKATLVRTEREYSSRTISDIELIFHIYSGRLIQNYQRGLGLFIDRGEGQKLQFSTAERSEHDATLSMSSGQLSALSLAFFLSLNRVYAKNPFVLIDDPAQSLDDINVASLTDLLRCELKDRQLVMSSHEDDIAAYMRYRFERAKLSQKAFHMQSHVEAPLIGDLQ